MKKLLLVVILAAPVHADHGYRVLLPMYVPTPLPGAYGSQWKTTLAIHNPSAAAEFHIDWCPGSSIPVYNACSRILLGEAYLQRGETQTDQLPRFNPGPEQLVPAPRLLYISPLGSPQGDPSQLGFSLRAFDVSRSATNAGTEVPVVHEGKFRKETLHLLNVPTDPNFRLTLRLYETQLKVAGFTIRIYDQAAGTLLGQRDVQLSFRHEHHWSSMFEPPFLEIGDLTALVPAGTALPSALRVEVQPRSEGSEFWSFVSITNNTTQHLTLVTPQ